MKNKFYISVLSFLLSFNLFAQATFKTPDILIETQLDYDWTTVLVKKLRTLFNNFEVADPFKGQFSQPILVNQSEVGSFLPKESVNLINDFGKIVGLDFLKAETKVWMHGFNYEIKDFKADLQTANAIGSDLILSNKFAASEIQLSAEKLSLNLSIPGMNNLPVINIEILNPLVRASEEEIINFSTKIKLEDMKTFIKFNLAEANFEEMANNLLNHSDKVFLTYDKILIPDLTIRLGSKNVKFSQEKIEKVLKDNHDAIKGILIAEASKILLSKTTTAALKVIEQYKLQKNYWFNTNLLQSFLGLKTISNPRKSGNLQISMTGDFCTVEKFRTLGVECINKKLSRNELSRITPEDHKSSLGLIRDLFEYREANIIASLSEDYLSKLLMATYDAGLFNDVLSKSNLVLGDKKMAIRLDKKGKSATLLMDVIYKSKKMDSILTGAKFIRFPLVIDMSLRVFKKDDIPVLILRINDADASEETIRNGLPQLGMPSNVNEIPRLRGKVVKSIRDALNSIGQKDIVELPYPNLKGLGFETIDFLSDGHGRMNAIMKLEELLEN